MAIQIQTPVNKNSVLDFIDILKNLDRKYEIIHSMWTEDKKFEVKFRTQVDKNNEDLNGLCDQWVDSFSEVTNTVWVKKVSNTGPKVRFRKQYQCWTHGGKNVQKELLFDSRKCRATLDMKILTDNPLTRRKNKYLKLGLNVVVKMNFIHLHLVNKTDPFSFFVQNCEPQLDVPKPVTLLNDRLPQLVAEMIQRGLNSSPKVLNQESTTTDKTNIDTKTNPSNQIVGALLLDSISTVDDLQVKNNHIYQLHDPTEISNHLHEQTLQLVQNIPVQTFDGLKLEMQPLQFTQVVVSGSNLDMSESLLMCQPLLFDTTQVTPVSSHSINPHFVQMSSQHQGQFL